MNNFKTIELGEVNKHYKQKKSIGIKLIDCVLVFYFICILSYLIFSIVFIKAQVIGISMQPLFNKNLQYSQNSKDYENSIYQDVAYANRFDKGSNGDIVLIEIMEKNKETGKLEPNIVIKRIIAHGGQRVTLRRESDGFFYYYVSNNRNELGTKLVENYVSEDARKGMDENYFKLFKDNCTPSIATEDGTGAYYVIPEGKVFVLGDNRPPSYDSHYFGSIEENKIMGKVCFYYAYNQNLFSFVWQKFCSIF